MTEVNRISLYFEWLFSIIVFAIGALNILLVHAVPGIVYLLLSLIYLPPVNTLLKESFRISIPPLLKVMLGIIIIWFTLGISDLGNMLDKAVK